jgi:hypothetical protein
MQWQQSWISNRQKEQICCKELSKEHSSKFDYEWFTGFREDP